MTYAEAIYRFRTKYQIECLKREAREIPLTNQTLLALLSEPYAELANKHYLVRTSGTIDLVSGQYSYSSGTGASNLPTALLKPAIIRINDSGATEPLDLVSMEDMPAVGGRSTGLPTKYAIDYVNGNRVLLLDTTPDKSYADDSSYRLNMDYYKKIFVYSGTAENSFSDLDWSASDYGGSFQTPTEWDEMIILGTLGGFFGDLKQEYEIKQRQMEKIEYYNPKLTYNIAGILHEF